MKTHTSIIAFAILFLSNSALFAMKAVKYDRYFVDHGKKRHESVTISANLMRVEGVGYKYIIDMTSKQFVFSENASAFGVKLSFRKLIEQIRRDYIPFINTLEGLKVTRAGKPEKYKMFKTLKSTIAIKDDGFMTVRFVKKDPHNIFVRRFFDGLYLQLGMIPMELKASGVVNNSVFNTMSATLGKAYDYNNKGLQSFPVYVYKSSTVSQIDLSNFQPITTSKELMYKGIVNIKKKFWYTNILKQIEFYYNKAMEVAVHVLFGKASKPKNEDMTIGLKEGDPNTKQVNKGVKKGVDYDLFWKSKECNFRKLRSRLLFLTGGNRGMIFDSKTIPELAGLYKDAITFLSKQKNTDGKQLDDELRKKFKSFIISKGYKRAKVRKSTLVKHPNLCYLNSRLFKKYSHLVKSHEIEE